MAPSGARAAAAFVAVSAAAAGSALLLAAVDPNQPFQLLDANGVAITALRHDEALHETLSDDDPELAAVVDEVMRHEADKVVDVVAGKDEAVALAMIRMMNNTKTSMLRIRNRNRNKK